jgi:hypothetical protein
MKKFYLSALLVFIFKMTYPQGYQCVYPGITSFFSDGTEINAIKLDSVTSETGCLVSWNYPAIRPVSADMGDWCFSDHGGSWIGRKFRVFPNGDHLFYNISGSPILIKTQALLNETWICYERNDLKIRAAITDISIDSFIGLTDSVKTISLQALDSAGNNITHEINNKQFKISKSHGFVKLVALHVFPDIQNEFIPDQPNEFTLNGLTSPVAGIQNLTARACYNFELGDELHTIKSSSYWGSQDQQYTRSVKKLIAKSYSQNLDTLFLTWDVCSRETWSSGVNDTNFYFKGETSEVIIFPEIEKVTDKLPGEIISLEGSNYNRAFNDIYGKPAKNIYFGFYSIPDDTCIRMYFVNKSSKTTTTGYKGVAYVEGLGGGYNFHIDFYTDLYQLVYWKKGNEEWGTPYSCSELLGDQEINKVPGFSVYPNPVRDNLNIRMSADIIDNLIVSDMSGRRIIEKNLNQNDYILSTIDLQPGIYFLVINNQIRVKFIKK